MAKFKPGDKVRYLIGTDKDKSKVHTVLETTIEGGREMVWFDDDGRGGNGIWADSLVKVNSRACNVRSRNAVVAKALNACGTARNATENDARQALAEIKGLTLHVTAIKSKIRALGDKVREITHFKSGLDYKMSSQVSDAYYKLMSDLWAAANAG